MDSLLAAVSTLLDHLAFDWYLTINIMVLFHQEATTTADLISSPIFSDLTETPTWYSGLHRSPPSSCSTIILYHACGMIDEGVVWLYSLRSKLQIILDFLDTY
jgi:hypothetical protein